MYSKIVHKLFIGGVVAAFVFLAGCATTQKTVSLQPGTQITNAQVNPDSEAVTQQQDSVEVSVQAAMLPGPYDNTTHPSFWVTVQNNRSTQISLKPAAARMIDSFGNQFDPVPMAVETNNKNEVDQYVIVDPEIHAYFGLHYGWPFYPMYPYRAWRRHGHFFRGGFGWHDPFWGFGPRVIWVRRINTEKSVGNRPEKEEVIYHNAKITYLVTFPNLQETVKDVRLVIPGVTIQKADKTASLNFELVFNQIIEFPAEQTNGNVAVGK